MEVKAVFVDFIPEDCRDCEFAILGAEQSKDTCSLLGESLPTGYRHPDCLLQDEFLRSLISAMDNRKRDEHIEALEKCLQSSWEMADIADDAAEDMYSRLTRGKCERKYKNQCERWLHLHVLELEGKLKELEKKLEQNRGEG